MAVIVRPSGAPAAADTSSRFSPRIWKNKHDFDAKLESGDACLFFDDFHTYLTTHNWTLTQIDAGSASVISGLGGILRMTSTDATDDGVSLQLSTGSVGSFIPTAGTTVAFEARVKMSAAAAGQYFIGLSDVDATIFSGGVLNVSDAMGFYSDAADVDENLDFISIAAAGSNTNTADAYEGTAATWVKLGLVVDGVSSVTPFVDGQPGTAITTTANIPAIAICPTFASLSESADALLDVDWIKCAQTRA